MLKEGPKVLNSAMLNLLQMLEDLKLFLGSLH
jgi:hypothetical protein